MAKFDDIKDRGVLFDRGEELLRARSERLQQKSVDEVRILERIAQDQEEIDKLINNMEMKLQKKMEAISKLSARQEELKKVAARLQHGREHGVEKLFQSSVRSAIGSRATTEDIASVYRSSATLGPAVSAAQRMSTEDLEAQIAKRRTLLQRQEGRILEAAANINQPGGEQSFKLHMQARQRIIEDIGRSQAAIQAQRKLGLDTQSQYFSAAETVRRVSSERERMQIREDVSAGRAGSRGQVERMMEDAGQRLIETFAKLDEAVKSSADNIGDLTKEFKDLEAQYEKHAATLSEMDKQGVGGGGIAEGISKAFGVIGDLGVIVQGIGQGYRYNQVTSELSQTQQRIGFANLANKRFEDTYAAAKGDMSALRRSMSGAYAKDVNRGLEFGRREDKALLMEMIGKGGQTADKVVTSFDPIEAAASFRFGGPIGIGKYLLKSLPEAGAAATPDALQFNRMLTDYSKQIPQRDTVLSSVGLSSQLQDAISKIDDFAAQQTADYLHNLTLATRGLGVGEVGDEYYRPITVRGSGLMGGERAISAHNMGDIDPLVEYRKADGFIDIKKTLDAIQDGSMTEEQKYFLRRRMNPGTDPDAIDITKHLPDSIRWPATGSLMNFDMAKKFIKDQEGLSLKAYRDTSKGYSIGYGHFVPGGSQAGRSITREQAEALFESDFASHSSAVDKMLGEDVLSRLNEEQRGALYSLAYNAGPQSLKYGGESSILSRLQRGDIAGAGQQILKTATTSDGSVDPALAKRREGEYRMFSGQGVVPTNVPGPHTRSGGITATGKDDSIQRIPSGGITATGKDDSIQRIPSEGITTTGIAGGGRRQKIQELFADEEVIRMIADRSGIKRDDIPKIVQFGISTLGAEFADDPVNQVIRSGQLARTGYTNSPEQYFEARSQLSSVGGGGDDLEEIMRSAVKDGLDASKNIMEMVEATTELARSSALAGIDATGGAAEMIAIGTQELTSRGLKQKMAQDSAAFAARRIEEIATSKDEDLANSIEFARLRKRFPKASEQELETMAEASPAELRKLKKLFKEGETDKEKLSEARKMASENMHFGNQVNTLEDVSDLLGITNDQVLMRIMGIGVDTAMEKSILEKRKTGEPLSSEERSFLGGRGRTTQGRSFSADAGFAILTKDAPDKKELVDKPGGLVASGEDKIRSEAIADAKVFANGVAIFKEAVGGLEGLGPAMSKFAESVDPEKFADAVKKSAENLTVPVNQFSENLAEFNTTVGNFVNDLKSLIQLMTKTKSTLQDNVNPKQTRPSSGRFY